MSAIWKLTVPLLALFFAVASGLAIIGGPTNADPSEQEVKDALQYTVDHIIGWANTPFLRKLTRVGDIKQQVVVGMMYVLTVEMARTNCTKEEEETQCVVYTDPMIASPIRCNADVWKHPITEKYEMMKMACVA
ncbi:hypothetical protein ANANG_G00304040 [Anguilla anguilla]|uniref:Cystatin domain-containing protein n=1 Tax=Anguilla anguilla TaxID=7936 RepID=A0A9D3LJN6_ANGAN|nr:hypothetical protein ANANG_G00304040 [Anguilla anguilla]